MSDDGFDPVDTDDHLQELHGYVAQMCEMFGDKRDDVPCDAWRLRENITAALTDRERIRSERDNARYEFEAMQYELFETEREKRELGELVRVLLKSAHPHPVHHPTMWAAWQRAEEYLQLPDNERRVDRAACSTCSGSGHTNSTLGKAPCPICNREGALKKLPTHTWCSISPGCHAAKDGECSWDNCPQLRDGEPEKTGRHCPRDTHDDE